MDATFTTPYLLVSDPQALTVLHADRDDDDRRALDRVEGAEAVLWAEAELPMRAEGCRQGEQLAVTRLPRRLVSQRRPESPQIRSIIEVGVDEPRQRRLTLRAVGPASHNPGHFPTLHDQTIRADEMTGSGDP